MNMQCSTIGRVVAINDTVYCDTYKIAEALESLYPHSNEHPSLFPKALNLGDQQSSILQKTLVQFVADRPLFKLAVALMPWENVSTANLHSQSVELSPFMRS
jgi:hypothetical protein